MQVGCEYVCVLVDGAVLYYLIAGTANLHNLVETAIEEVYLQVETPSLHVFIKIIQIRIIIHIFKMGLPAIMLRKEAC